MPNTLFVDCMITVSRLFVYPVKSLGGVALQHAEISDRGLKHDRRWMLIDDNNRFLSQRSHAHMALFKITFADDGFTITYQADQSSIFIDFDSPLGQSIRVSIWDDECSANLLNDEWDSWFTQKLCMNCRLVYMPDEAYRPVDSKYASRKEGVSFADAYPFLAMTEASLEKLNEKLSNAVFVDRFRPNIVFAGAEAHFEDRMAEFTINDIRFFGVKPCARCVMVGIDQQTAEAYKEPMKTLANYRTKNNKVYFGQNLLHKGNGTIKIGDKAEVLRLNPEFIA